MISFLSICSGIEAASVALAPLGFSAIGFAEIDKACARLLAHRIPGRRYGLHTQAPRLVCGRPVRDGAGS